MTKVMKQERSPVTMNAQSAGTSTLSSMNPMTPHELDMYRLMLSDSYQQNPDFFHSQQQPSVIDPSGTSGIAMENLHTMPIASLPSQHSSASDMWPSWPFVVTNGGQSNFHDDPFYQIAALQYFDVPSENQTHDLVFRPPMDTLEPKLMLRHNEANTFADRVQLSNLGSLSANHTDEPSIVGYPSSPYQPVTHWEQPLTNDYDLSSSNENSSSPLCKLEEDEEQIADKPYARLIYEALLQAQGYRMTLREIYEWFLKNTSKPRESGTNGWQNSIRHNLSMNQAFENDKGISPPAKGVSRKANSVWVLTDHAIRYGIQSTTRYRKTGQGKKGAMGRVPALQRQRSGARGGRAARRSAARLRKQEEGSISPDAHLFIDPPELALLHGVNHHSASAEYNAQRDIYPPTPEADSQFEQYYTLPVTSHPARLGSFHKDVHEEYSEDADAMYDYLSLGQYDTDSEHGALN